MSNETKMVPAEQWRRITALIDKIRYCGSYALAETHITDLLALFDADSAELKAPAPDDELTPGYPILEVLKAGLATKCEQAGAADRIEQLEGRLHDADLQGAKLEAEREHYRHVWATEIDRANRAELTIKAIRDLPRYNRYQVMDDTADDNSSRWILADKLEALLPKE